MRSGQIQTNFTAGEISPRMFGRVDLPQYANAAATMENAYPVIQGGAVRSPGSRYVAETKTSGAAWLVPFVFSTTQAYVLEFGVGYIRFYRDKAQLVSGTPVEVASPYAAADLPALEFTQQADTLIVFHPGYYPRRLVRESDTRWKFTTVPFLVEPAEEVGEAPNVTCTLSATTGSITATAGSSLWTQADVGRQIAFGTGLATITAYTSATQVSATVVDAFSTTALPSGGWVLTESPKTQCTPSATGPEGTGVTLTTGTAAWKSTSYDAGAYVWINDGLVEITSVTSGTVANGIVRVPLASAAAAASGGWRRMPKVWGTRFGFPSTGVFHDQRLIAAGAPGLPGYVWGTRIGEYLNFARGTNDDDGFSFEMVSAEYNRVLHLVASRVLVPLTSGGEFAVSGSGDQVLGPVSARRAALSDYGCGQARPVRFGNDIIFVQASGRKIRALAYTSEREGYTAPDLTRFAEHVTESGIIQMAMQREPESLLWCVRADGTLAVLTLYREAQEADQGLNGWSRRVTDGWYESVCRIPAGGVDQVWAVVRRTVNGVTKRYVEVFEDERNTDASVVGTTFATVSGASWATGTVTITRNAHGYTTGDTVRHRRFAPAGYNGDYVVTVTGPNTYTYALATNPGTVSTLGQAGKATATWSGLSHLEAKSCDVLADGVVMPRQTVASGAVTLPRAAYEVEIGLPYTSTIKLLPIEVSPGTGSSQGSQLSVHDVIVRLKGTLGLTIEGVTIPFRQFGASILDREVPPFTGDKRLGRLSNLSDGGVVTLQQQQPLPFHVLAVVRKFTFNDG
jgi:hypothetical protein